MRIAFLTTEYTSEPVGFDGGLANYLRRVALALASLGHQPLILVPADGDGVLHDQGVEIHRVAMRRWGPYEMFNRLSLHRLHISALMLRTSRLLVRRALQLHRARHIDIIQYPHLHGLALLRPSSIPAVARLSGWGPLWRQHGDGSGSLLQSWQQSALERLALGRVDAIYSPSGVMADHVSRTIHLPVRLIENPFLLDQIVADLSPWRQQLAGKRYLLFFGQLIRLKGILTIAEILPVILARHPQLHLVFAGKERLWRGPGRSAVDYLMQRAGDQRHRLVHFTSLRHDQLYPIIANADTVWLPSLVDNLPNSCLEAMAFGRVVVGTRGASFEQVIEPGVSGLLCAPADAAGLLASTEEALALSPERRQQMGSRACERIARMHPTLACGALMQFYGEVIAKRQRKTLAIT